MLPSVAVPILINFPLEQDPTHALMRAGHLEHGHEEESSPVATERTLKLLDFAASAEEPAEKVRDSAETFMVGSKAQREGLPDLVTRHMSVVEHQSGNIMIAKRGEPVEDSGVVRDTRPRGLVVYLARSPRLAVVRCDIDAALSCVLCCLLDELVIGTYVEDLAPRFVDQRFRNEADQSFTAAGHHPDDIVGLSAPAIPQPERLGLRPVDVLDRSSQREGLEDLLGRRRLAPRSGADPQLRQIQSRPLTLSPK